MIPVLYSAAETSFATNGLGGLANATSCYVTETRNTQGGYFLNMEYPIDGIHYGDILPERIVYASPAPHRAPQPFRIAKITKPINGIVKIEAPHVSSELQTITTYSVDTDTNIQGMCYNLMWRARQLGQTVPFWLTTDITVPSPVTFNHPLPISIADALLGTEGSVLDVVGGEFEFDKWHIILHNQRGHDSNIEIRYGVNMTDMKAETDARKLVTAVVPYWSGTVDEQDVIVIGDMCVSTNAGAYAYVRCIPLDVSSEFDLESGQTPVKDQVTAKGTSYINATDQAILNTSISVQYESITDSIGERPIYLCDTVRVVHPDMKLSATAKVVKTKYNVLTDRYDTITIGSINQNIVDTIAKIIKKG